LIHIINVNHYGWNNYTLISDDKKQLCARF